MCKRFLIVSDTHGRDQNLKHVLAIEKNIDGFFHLGDLEGSENYLGSEIHCPCYMVAGNNDFESILNQELCVNLGPHRIFMTHGHRHMLFQGVGTLVDAARQRNADIVMFGHTHCPMLEIREDITILNPGSLSLPRQYGWQASYMIMTMDDDGMLDYEIKYI